MKTGTFQNNESGAQLAKIFWGGKVTFGNDYDAIDVQSTMMRLFCYGQLTNIGGGTFFIVGGHGCPQEGTKWAFASPANWHTNQTCPEYLKSTV